MKNTFKAFWKELKEINCLIFLITAWILNLHLLSFDLHDKFIEWLCSITIIIFIPSSWILGSCYGKMVESKENLTEWEKFNKRIKNLKKEQDNA